MDYTDLKLLSELLTYYRIAHRLELKDLARDITISSQELLDLETKYIANSSTVARVLAWTLGGGAKYNGSTPEEPRT